MFSRIKLLTASKKADKAESARWCQRVPEGIREYQMVPDDAK